MPDAEDLLEGDVEDDEVQQRVQQRPREAEDAVLVLDLELFADHPDEQLAVLDDARKPLAGAICGPDDSARASPEARRWLTRLRGTGPAGRSRLRHPLRSAAAGPGSAGGPTASARAPRPRARRFRRARGCGRSGCGAGARDTSAAHRAVPARHERADRRAPEVEVAGDDLRSVQPAMPACRNVSRCRSRAKLPDLRRRVQADRPRRAARRSSSVSASACRVPAGSARGVPIGIARRWSTGKREQIASSQMPTARHEVAARCDRAPHVRVASSSTLST